MIRELDTKRQLKPISEQKNDIESYKSSLSGKDDEINHLVHIIKLNQMRYKDQITIRQPIPAKKGKLTHK